MENRYAIFDLDGTIIDSVDGIKDSIRYSLTQNELSIIDENIINNFIGYPLIDSYMKYFNVNERKANYLISFYRDYYKEIGLFNVKLYEGILTVIKLLKKNGYKISIISLKPKVFVYRILKNLNIFEYFDNIIGVYWNNYRVTKAELMKIFTKNYKINLSNSYIIGDRGYDILVGKKFGINTVGVSYGYGSTEELKSVEPNFIVNKSIEILNCVRIKEKEFENE